MNETGTIEALEADAKAALRSGDQKKIDATLAALRKAIDDEADADARAEISVWRSHYNHRRPHLALGYRFPAEIMKSAASRSGAASQEDNPSFARP